MPFKDEKKRERYFDKISKRGKAKTLVKKNRSKYINKLKGLIDSLRRQRNANIIKGLWRFKDGKEVEGEYYQSLLDNNYYVKLPHFKKFRNKRKSLNFGYWVFIKNIEDKDAPT